MGLSFQFDQSLDFEPGSASEILRVIPPLPGVFALRAPHPAESNPDQPEPQPYLTRAADLRRRITRLLAPPDSQSKRLNLRDRVARIEYTVTGSEFESTLALYHASASIFGLEEARRRLKLRTPYCLRFTAENPYPRVYSTNRLSKRALANIYGPFASRAAADRYCDAVLDLFKLRRCYEDLAPAPDHPGCVYGEMNKCLAPCNQAHTPEGAAAYSAEAAAVKRFFDTRGESMIVDLGLAREEASAAMEFEQAAQLHAQWHKVKAAQSLAAELVQPLPNLRAVIVQKSAPLLSSRSVAEGAASSSPTMEADQAAIFLLHAGCLIGPAPLSTLGVRAVKEQTSVGSSLFAQPLMLQPIPLPEPDPSGAPGLASETQVGARHLASEMWDSATKPSQAVAALATTLSPELRAASLIVSLEAQASTPTDLATLSDHLSLLRRWYYRPEKQRAGEIFFPDANGQWPIRRILNAAARAVLGDPAPMAETHRDLAIRNPTHTNPNHPNPDDPNPDPAVEGLDDRTPQTPTRTKILHPGRPGVERIVHVIDPPPARPTFKTRRTSPRKP